MNNLASNDKVRAPRNRTLTLNKEESTSLKKSLVYLTQPTTLSEIENKTINQDIFKALDYLPDKFIDLLFVDPPYNLSKEFNKTKFKEMKNGEYELWLDLWISKLPRLMKPDASIYICGDWKSSCAIYNIASKYFKIQNRITWEREKGRGAKSNWKNCSEDIWFCTMSDKFHFDVEAVKLKRKVIAPYKDQSGVAKDWNEESDGKFRITYPSNLWTDISIPFWSMPENTDHPTQKPEKLLAKIILASSKKGSVVFDPFLGSGTTSVTAKKLGRKYVGIELDEYYCLLSEKRLNLANHDKSIQGYNGGVFWERNTMNESSAGKVKHSHVNHDNQANLFMSNFL
ncbi:MAG: hypothetical protein ACD_40C00014G0003 [uncultured bacterium]|nr:MAG: hypothetical protein ACD_40C00014G0003 [uncultured bacterium]KKU14516.1 MAG: methylase N-4/N-6 domain protein [Microgenomates group bacterium GW2011_GWC2_45_8]KKU25734.1 MAG: methylase N-4/N-6 domain protein [Microgenomates group bacterium GW2011_GWA2_46_16]